MTCLQPFTEFPAALRFHALLQELITYFSVEIYLLQHPPVKGNIWKKRKNIFISENSSSSLSKWRFVLYLPSFAKSWPGFTFLFTNLLFPFLAVCCCQAGDIPGCPQLLWGHLNFKKLHVGVCFWGFFPYCIMYIRHILNLSSLQKITWDLCRKSLQSVVGSSLKISLARAQRLTDPYWQIQV